MPRSTLHNAAGRVLAIGAVQVPDKRLTSSTSGVLENQRTLRLREDFRPLGRATAPQRHPAAPKITARAAEFFGRCYRAWGTPERLTLSA